jgi:hypothetical protein
MDQLVLEIRCGTLQCLLDRISKINSESEKLRIAVEASRIADRILSVTPKDHYAYETIESNLDHFSLAVFCNHQEWAQQSLDNIKEISRPLF